MEKIHYRNIWDPNFPPPNPFRKETATDDYTDDEDKRWVEDTNVTNNAWKPKSIIDDEEAKELFY